MLQHIRTKMSQIYSNNWCRCNSDNMFRDNISLDISENTFQTIMQEKLRTYSEWSVSLHATNCDPKLSDKWSHTIWMKMFRKTSEEYVLKPLECICFDAIRKICFENMLSHAETYVAKPFGNTLQSKMCFTKMPKICGETSRDNMCRNHSDECASKLFGRYVPKPFERVCSGNMHKICFETK